MMNQNQLSNQVYHQKQQGYNCGMHALNNLLGQPIYSEKIFNKICNQLSPNKGLFSINPHRGWFGGDFDINVIEMALQQQNYSLKWINQNLSLESFDFKNQNLIGFIINIQNQDFFSKFIPEFLFSKRHWYAIKKVKDNFIMLDSKNDNPTIFSTTGKLISYLELIKKTKNSYLLYVEKNK